MPDPIELDEIEVLGERLRRRINPNVSIGQVVFSVWDGAGRVEFQPADRLQMDGLFDGDIQIIEPPQTPTVRISPAIDKSHPDYNKILQKTVELANQIARLNALVEYVQNNQVLSFPRSNTMIGAEFKALWYKISYVITSVNYGPGRGGEVLINSATGQATSYVSISTLEGYQNQGGEFGLNYYLLHELSHTTPEALGYNQSQYNLYINRNGAADPNGQYYYSEPEGISAERFANAITQEMGNHAGTSLWPNPPYGYAFP